MKTCPRCDGSGEEPGAPLERDGAKALCGKCNGAGEIEGSKNTNCLEGFRCPECGQEDELLIYAEVRVSLRDDGSEVLHGWTDWNRDSVAECPECGHEGKVEEFFTREA